MNEKQIKITRDYISHERQKHCHHTLDCETCNSDEATQTFIIEKLARAKKDGKSLEITREQRNDLLLALKYWNKNEILNKKKIEKVKIVLGDLKWTEKILLKAQPISDLRYFEKVDEYYYNIKRNSVYFKNDASEKWEEWDLDENFVQQI